MADEVQIQSFRSVPTFSWAYGMYYFFMVLAALLIPFLPVAAAVLALVNTLAYLLECHTFEVYTKILPKDRSQNVIARKSNPSEEGEMLSRVVLVAHYDTSRSGLSFHPKLVAGFRKSFILLNVCMAVILILALGAGIMALFGLEMLPVYNYLALPFALYVLFSCSSFTGRSGVSTPLAAMTMPRELR
jgi:type IV secretory pathway TrbD component